MADNPIILLHPVREPLDQTAVGALELLARMMLPMDTAERTLFWEGIVADIVSKGLLRGLSPQRAQEGADDLGAARRQAAHRVESGRSRRGKRLAFVRAAGNTGDTPGATHRRLSVAGWVGLP